MTYIETWKAAGLSRLFPMVARSRPVGARPLLSNLTEHFDSREIPLDPFLKIPAFCRSNVLSSKNKRVAWVVAGCVTFDRGR